MLGIRELKVKDTTWISLVRPTEDNIKALSERFPHIHSLVLEELLTPTIRPRVENYDDHLYMVLHFPKFVPGPEKSIAHELDFILLKDALITVQYDDLPAIEDLWRECENALSAGSRHGKTPANLLYYILRPFFSTALKELDIIQGEIDEIEENVFSGREKILLENISILKRDVLDFRRSFKPQHLTLESLVIRGTHLYGDGVRPFLTDLVGEYLKVWNLLETHKEALDALYDTNHQLLAAKTNEIMKVFTILAFISFIPTVVANIYGMNIAYLPFAENVNAFWIVQGIMVGITVAVYLVLKWRRLV